MKKKVYRYYTDKGGMKHCWVNVFQSSSEQDCTMCKSLNNFIDVDYEKYKNDIPRKLLRKLLNLARTALKRHLASGKHWEQIDGYLKTKGGNDNAVSSNSRGVRYIPGKEHRPATKST